MRKPLIALAIIGATATTATAHVDQPDPPQLKQKKKLKVTNKMQDKAGLDELVPGEGGFTWNKMRNRYRMLWDRFHPPREHSHFNPNAVYPGAPTWIINCESGGNPRAVSPGGTYRGLYQFDYQTWASVGGTGDPAAATPYEQHKRAAILYAQRGSQPWPVCG